MKQYQKSFSILAFLLFGLAAAGYLVWRKGTPYQTPYWSPNKHYFVQKYSNLTLSNFMPVMPGQGSDAVDGYIRLFDKHGNLIDERFVIFSRDVKPVWAGDKVYLMCLAEMDDNPWILPSSSD